MYSQNDEEKHILDYFGSHKGTFIDIGANDGKTLSNTRALLETGWSGVMVEPSPKAFARLKENCKQFPKGQVYCYPFAIGDHNGKAVLNESGELLSTGDVGLVSTFHYEEMDRFMASVKYEKVEVKVFRWKTFMNRLKIKTFDFVSVDTEGNDAMILSQMDLSNTKMVCAEWNGSKERKDEFDKILEGFRVIYTSAENLLYAR